ncbi:MAG: transcriptional regulator [Deltaproteobacteria bacterium]|nr:transcriptional regulator [Deltaproteobacteria bacterium]
MAKKKLPRGWVEGSARKLLGLSREESAIIEMRLRLCDEVRSKRLAKGITQQELAARIESTQPRVAKLERGDASFEMMLLALLALGASRREIARVLAAG